MEIIQIEVETRQDLGRKSAKAVRQDGKIPGVLYSKKNGVSHFTTTHNAVKSVVYTPDLKLAELNINGELRKAILQEVCFHPVTDEIQHLDFLELVDGQPLKAEIPVKFKGTSPGVKNGGKLVRTLRKVKVKTTPASLVDTLYVDISKLLLGGAVRVKDIQKPQGVEILVEGAIPVANVAVPRALKGDELSPGLGEDSDEENAEENSGEES